MIVNGNPQFGDVFDIVVHSRGSGLLGGWVRDTFVKHMSERVVLARKHNIPFRRMVATKVPPQRGWRVHVNLG